MLITNERHRFNEKFWYYAECILVIHHLLNPDHHFHLHFNYCLFLKVQSSMDCCIYKLRYRTLSLQYSTVIKLSSHIHRIKCIAAQQRLPFLSLMFTSEHLAYFCSSHTLKNPSYQSTPSQMCLILGMHCILVKVVPCGQKLFIVFVTPNKIS